MDNTLDLWHRQYARTRNERLREMLILHHQRLVQTIASRFLSAGETLEDLVQIGNIGLINALDRYDPDQGTRFSTYATPTILGEIKRHFRDKASAIRVPRLLQELQARAAATAQLMTHELGRVPTIAELSARLGRTEEEILQALEAGEAAMNLQSLDSGASPRQDNGNWGLAEVVGQTDGRLQSVESLSCLRAALHDLGAQEREIVALRFFAEMSQAKIARRLNLSQMQVSRLQQRALKRLREQLTTELVEPRFEEPQLYGFRAR